MSRVVLAMSGGVDSSVAAHLLVGAGHDVIGVFMRHGQQSPVACGSELSGATAGLPTRVNEKVRAGAAANSTAGRASSGTQTALPVVNRLDHKQGCCTAADAEDARRVADRLDIPFYALNLEQEFGRIIDYFVAEYTVGRTPNPCVQCNNWIKFGKLFDYADSVGAEFVATGHYARLSKLADDIVALTRGVDAAKDQSYVLFGIDREYLPRMMLPVGEYEKPTIREIAAGLGLRVADKKDSQEICFVTRDRYDAFVRGQRAANDDAIDTTGELVTTDGTVVARHAGIEGFTVGQRKGLGVALGSPKFVARIEADTRRVVLGDRAELYRRELTAGGVNWLAERDDGGGDSQRCFAQIRYNADAYPATLTVLPDERLQICFDEPQFAITPGQAVVCYDASENQRVLCGGWIE